MGKLGFIFPGQGAQYVGMGKEFYDSYESAAKVYALAEEASEVSVRKLCFTDNDMLPITEYTQIAMLTTELAILKVIEEYGMKPDVTAGLSLGEYGALAASHVMHWQDLLWLVRKRGMYMQEAYPEGGAMAAVLGLSTEIVEETCDKVAGMVNVANYNCPGQLVITGEKDAVDTACEALKNKGAKRCIPLQVSGPFHSSLLTDAGRKLGEALGQVQTLDFSIPYVNNVEAVYVTDKTQVKALLQKQVSSSVRWQQSMERMIADGVDTFLEIGPGKTLAGFTRKIDQNVTVYSISTPEDLEKAMSAMKGATEC